MNEANEFAEVLTRHFSPYGALSRGQIEALYAHYALMERWNRVLNLTTVKGLEETVVRHYCESLFLGTRLPAGNFRVLDVGSGPGFPGFPLGILRPECEVTLVESHQRKAVFLKEAARGRANIKVAAKRAEDLDCLAFDWVVSRAVRWEAVAAVATGKIALLLGEEDAGAAAASGGFEWNAPCAIPWGKRRVLLMGHRQS